MNTTKNAQVNPIEHLGDPNKSPVKNEKQEPQSNDSKNIKEIRKYVVEISQTMWQFTKRMQESEIKMENIKLFLQDKLC